MKEIESEKFSKLIKVINEIQDVKNFLSQIN